MNYLLTIEYEGTRYEGWQRQKKTTQTIQGKLEQVLSRMTEKEIEIDGAGHLCQIRGTGIGAVSCKTLGRRKMLFLPDRNG